MRFIFMAMLLVGCGTESRSVEVETPVPFYIDTAKVDTKLLPYVMEFAGYCEKFKTSDTCKDNFNKILSIKTVKSFDEKNVIGRCSISSSGKRWIEVLDSWLDLDTLSMRTVIIHELGHCTLTSGTANGFPHYDSEDDIMNSYLLSDKIVLSSWPQLIKAMFLRAGGTLPLTQEENPPIVAQSNITESGGLACETREDSISRH